VARDGFLTKTAHRTTSSTTIRIAIKTIATMDPELGPERASRANSGRSIPAAAN
jgi:hypothetical protein